MPGRPRIADPLVGADLPAEDEVGLDGALVQDADLADAEVALWEVRRSRLVRVSLDGAHLDRLVFTDCAFDTCSLGAVRAQRCSLIGVRLQGCRLSGGTWTASTLREVHIVDCRADLVSFRGSTLTKVVFERCDLRRAEFEGADLRGARFADCDLTAAQFAGARADGAQLTGCTLDGLGGVTGLAGAVVRAEDLPALSRVLAAELGIVVQD